jgi:TM2 domain-containing membrane protein YozV
MARREAALSVRSAAYNPCRSARALALGPFAAHLPHFTVVSMSNVSTAPTQAFKSKTLTAALAFLFGWAGLHRFYLRGAGDRYGWLHVIGSALGVVGAWLMWTSERASLAGWILSVIGCVSVLAGFLAAIVYGLRPDERWDAKFNPDTTRRSQSGWTVVLIVIFSLFIGTGYLMSGLAFTFQTYFESQAGGNGG